VYNSSHAPARKLIYTQTINSGGELYVHAFTFRLASSCDPERLQRAWSRAVASVPMLRTSFHFATGAGRWVQAIHSALDFKWTDERHAELGGAAADAIAALSFAREEDFAHPPVHLRRVTTTDAVYFILVMHHALYDGLGIPLLLRHVRALYDADAPAPASALGFDALVDAILLQEHAGTDFWRARLAGAAPWRFPRTGEIHSAGAWRAARALDVPRLDVLRACRRLGVHAQCVGQAAWARVLARASGTADVVFGQVVSGRVLPGARDFIGPAFNTVPVHATLERGMSGAELLRRVHRGNVDALPWQHASLRSVQRALGVRSICDSLFLFQPGATERDGRAANAVDMLWELVTRKDDADESKTQVSFSVGCGAFLR
jgi:hypothetical protein